MIRFVFMGTPDYAKILLDTLLSQDDMECMAIFTQPDRPVGRKQVLTSPIVAEFAKERTITCYQPEKIGENESQIIQSLAPDFIIVAAYGQILRENILSIAPCINLHTSLLPQYRGASPLQESLLNGDEYVGITAIRMDKGLDTGDVLGFTYFPSPPEAKFECLLKHLGVIAGSLTLNVMRNFHAIAPLQQRNILASKVKKRSKQESLVTFSDAITLYRKFQAFFPWPGISFAEGMKIKDISLSTEQGQEGEILAITQEGVIVGCGKGAVLVKEVQPAGKNSMKADAYLRGKRLSVGDLWI